MKLKLISFALCPYVQRAVITLKWKNVPFDIEYIDLHNKPDWFLKISPTGKVPVLVIDDVDVIFESNIINELIDEICGHASLSLDPIKKAKERAWIQFADGLFTDLFLGTQGDSEKHFASLVAKLERLESVISDNGFFKGNGFSIIDSTYAPIFCRMQYIEYFADSKHYNRLKKVMKWQDNLLYQKFIKDSVVPDFEKLFRAYVGKSNPSLKLQPQICSI